MSEVLKWFEDNIYYSVNSGNVSFSIQNEDLWEFEELLKKQDRELQQKESIIKEVREYIEKYEVINGYYDSNYDGENDTYSHDLVKEDILEILDKENKQ